MIFVGYLMAELLTNVGSSGAIAPVVLSLSQAFGLNPLYVGLPVIISCQYVFILPTSSPCGVLVKDTNLVTFKEFVGNNTVI